MGLIVSVDGRPLDSEQVQAQGIGRYAHGLLGELPRVASEHGGEIVVRRRRGGAGSPFEVAGGETETYPARAGRSRRRPSLHHSLSLYDAPLVSRAPLVVTMHDVVPLQWPDEYLRTGLRHRLLYRAVRRAAAIVCPSDTARDDLLGHLDVAPEHVHVVPEGVGERFHPRDPSGTGIDGPYLLYVGGMAQRDARKDVEGLIDAFADWSRAEGRPETLVLTGAGGPATDGLAARAQRAGARTHFTGFVAEHDLPALYSGATCFVTASRYEGFGLPALEAIACGTPVVAYDAGAIPTTAGPGALLVPPGDGAALMRAAGRVCDDAEVAQRLAEEGRRHAAGFTWRRTAELTWDVYAGCLSPSARTSLA